MAPQQPTPTPSSGNGGQSAQSTDSVVTITLFTTPASAPSSPPSSPSGSSSKVPIGAIAGGAAGGITLAVILVLIWNYWGLVIKRTEKRRRKEVQDMLTVRENTRRNAMTRFKPQSSRRPVSDLNPEGRRVTFLARTPTFSRSKNTNAAAATPNDDNDGNADAGPAAIPPTEEIDVADREALPPESGTDGARPGQPSLSFVSAATHIPVEQQGSEGAEQQPEDEAPSTPSGLASSPGPSHSPSGPSNSSTPSHVASNVSSLRLSRSIRMRTPTRLPDAPATLPKSIRSVRTHHTRPSASTPSGSSQTSISPSRMPTSISASRAPEMLEIPSSSSTSQVPALSPDPVAGPSTTSFRPPSLTPISLSSFTWGNSPLRNSVLASDRPVVMPRPKNASAISPSESQPSSPTSTWGHAPTLQSSVSHASAGSGEPLTRSIYPDSLRHSKPPTETVDDHARISSYSMPSTYSND